LQTISDQLLVSQILVDLVEEAQMLSQTYDFTDNEASADKEC
jgi:hypothetical protein